MTTVAFRFCTGMDTFSSDLIYLALCLQHLAKTLPAKTEALSDTFEKEQKQRLLQRDRCPWCHRGHKLPN